MARQLSELWAESERGREREREREQKFDFIQKVKTNQ